MAFCDTNVVRQLRYGNIEVTTEVDRLEAASVGVPQSQALIVTTSDEIIPTRRVPQTHYRLVMSFASIERLYYQFFGCVSRLIRVNVVVRDRSIAH